MGRVLLISGGSILASSAMAAQATEIGRVLDGTPWFVYPLLALLVYLGFAASRSRRVSLARAASIPAAFLLWGSVGVAAKIAAAPVLGAIWLGLAGGGLALALRTIDVASWRIDRDKGIVEVPGSWLPLMRNLAIFAAKYGLAVAAAVTPAWRAGLAFWDVGLSGAMAGYFLGWLLSLALAYRRAAADPPRLEPEPSEVARS